MNSNDRPQHAREGLVIVVLRANEGTQYEQFEFVIDKFRGKFGERIWHVEPRKFTDFCRINCTMRMAKETCEEIFNTTIEYVARRGWRMTRPLSVPKELERIVEEVVMAPSQRCKE